MMEPSIQFRYNRKHRILVIEDNPCDFALVEEYLSEKIKDLHLSHIQTYREAKNILNNDTDDIKFDVILLDLFLPDKSGIELIKEIIILSKNVPVIILTGYENLSFSINSISLGVFDYLLKDELTPQILYKSILYSYEREKINLQLLDYIHAIEEKHEKLQEITSMQSQLMQALLARIIEIADLIKSPTSTIEEKEIVVDFLLRSAYQLDNIIKYVPHRAYENQNQPFYLG
jgi:DNA-binding NtrC family response regulator